MTRIYGNTVNDGAYLYLDYTIGSQNVGGNYTQVYWTLGMHFGLGTFRLDNAHVSWSATGGVGGNYSVSGINVPWGSGGMTQNGNITLASGTLLAVHNSDGYCTVSVSGGVSGSGYNGGGSWSSNLGGSFGLPRILNPPSAPGSIAYSNVGATQVDMDWMAPSNGAPFTSYDLQLATNSNFLDTNIVWEETGSWVIFYDNAGGLPKGTTVYGRVRAANSSGWGPWSSVTSFTTAITSSAPPTGLAFSSVTGTSLVLSWNAPSDTGGAPITGYVVQRALNNTFSSGLVTTNVTGTSLGVSGLSATTTYYFRVAAVNAGGTSSYSSVASRTTSAAVPGAPDAPTVGPITKDSAVASYTAPSNTGGSSITGYDVQRATNVGFTSNVATASRTASQLSYTFTGLTAGMDYYVRVRAKNSVGTGPWSDATLFHTPAGFSVCTDGVVWREVLWWMPNATNTAWRQVRLRPANGDHWS